MNRLDIRLPEQEKQILEAYCKLTKRSRTDVLREFIRSLSVGLSEEGDTGFGYSTGSSE